MPTFTLFRNEPDVRTFSAGLFIFAEGQPDDDLMYAVLDGEVDIVRQQRVLETILPCGVFGEMALLDNQPRSASAIAKTDCRVAAITEKRFTQVVSQNPHFALEMMRLLTERVRRNMAS
jgi:CRP/FNR family transcriptional regulator, cyclic AMP receptor protein